MKLAPAWAVLAAGVAIVAGASATESSARTAADAVVVTVAGKASGGAAGVGRLATETAVDRPSGVAATQGAGFAWVEPYKNVARMVGRDGLVTTLAGDGTAGSSGDGGPAAKARLDFPNAIAPTPSGGFLIADTDSDRIRYVDQLGTITTVAGTGSNGFGGDGGPATSAQLSRPRGVAALAGGGFLIADTGNARIRLVAPSGAISTVAGTGVRGYSGDGGRAVDARLASPADVVPTADGGFLIVDGASNTVRKVKADGTITTVAGTGRAGFSGDGGPATAALLSRPQGVAVQGDQGFLIADTGNERIRRVAPDGTITTFAGTGSAGDAGDGGSPTAAQLSGPAGLAVSADGTVLVSEEQGNRIRFVGVPAAPRNVSPPKILGEARVRTTLFSGSGGWSGTGPTARYGWLRCDPRGRACKAIRGANSFTYRVRRSDLGFSLRAKVTATNVAGSATAMSASKVTGRVVQTKWDSGRDAVAISGSVRVGSAPRLSLDQGRSIAVTRSRSNPSTWATSVGFVRIDTSPLPNDLKTESAELALTVLGAKSADRARLLVYSCPGTWPIRRSDFRTMPPSGRPAVSVAIAKLHPGKTTLPLPPSAVGLKSATELCLYVSGRVPRGENSVSLKVPVQLRVFTRGP